MQQKKQWGMVLLICLGIFLVLGFIKFMQIRAAIAFGESFPEPSETVSAMSVQTSQWQPKVSVIGEIRASQDLELRTELGGIIAEIGFSSGAEVKAGDVLIQLDIAEENAQLAALEPQIELARKDVKRLSGIGKGAVSQQLIDQANSQLAIATAQARTIRETIINKTVVAPFTGRTGLHDFEVGEFIGANTLITRLVGNLDTLWVDFAVPQKFADLSPGTKLNITAPDNLASSIEATVIAVEPNISVTTRSLRARALVDNSKRTLKPGMFVNVLAPLGNAVSAVRIPSTAVRVDSFGAFVFTLHKDDQQAWRAKRTPVEVATKDGFESIVSTGLEIGDLVATTGSFKLRDGILTNLASDAALDQTRDTPAASASATPIISDSNTTPSNKGDEDTLNAEAEMTDEIDALIKQPEPVIDQPEPVLEQPEPVLEQPEPVLEQPEPSINQPEPVNSPAETATSGNDLD